MQRFFHWHHPHLFMLKYSVRPSVLSVNKFKIKECRFTTALDDTDKENIRITLLKDCVTHARTHTQCGSNGRKSGYNNVDHHFPKFFLIHKF